MAEETTTTTEEVEETTTEGTAASTGLTAPEDDASAAEWKAYARKWEKAQKVDARPHQRARREAEKERDALAAQLREREDADKSEQDKALDTARAEAKAEAKAESDAERRADRLDAAVVRVTAKGVTVGTGDDAKTVKFADSDDVLDYIERALEKGDIDADDLFDSDSKVQTDALTAALVDLAVAKPHWLAGDAKPGPGENDAGKGSGAAKTLAEQIRAAQEKGDAKELVRLKNQKLFARPRP